MSESEPIDKMSRARLEEYAAQLEKDFQDATQLAKHFKLKIDGAADGNYKQMYEGVRQELDDMKQFIIMQGGGHVRNQLLNLPDQIKAQSQDNARTAELTEEIRAELATIEAEVEGSIAKDTELTNADKRKAAKKLALKGREDYSKKCADLAVLERAFKLGEIDLTHLNNLFRAYLAIAGIGVR